MVMRSRLLAMIIIPRVLKRSRAEYSPCSSPVFRM
jgi:hypothetical protein